MEDLAIKILLLFYLQRLLTHPSIEGEAECFL